MVQAGFVEVGCGAQTFAHRVDGDEIRLIQSARFLALCFCVSDVGQSACAQIVGSLQALGGVVVETVRILVSEEQGDRRGEDAQLVEVGIGDGVDR